MEQALGYVRVSSDEQSREGVSLDAQEARIRAYATLRGLELVAILREEGVSGKVALRKRPAGSKLVASLSKRGPQHVIAVKLDRLFRNTADALGQTEQWDKAKVGLHVIDMGGSSVDTTSAMGRMFFTVAAALAEMERNLTSERTKAALGHKKISGSAYCHVTPLGFDRLGDKLVPNEREMATVQRIKCLRTSGESLQAIADRMNAEGAPTKRGGNWHAVTVQGVLKVHSSN